MQEIKTWPNYEAFHTRDSLIRYLEELITNGYTIVSVLATNWKNHEISSALVVCSK